MNKKDTVSKLNEALEACERADKEVTRTQKIKNEIFKVYCKACDDYYKAQDDEIKAHIELERVRKEVK